MAGEPTSVDLQIVLHGFRVWWEVYFPSIVMLSSQYHSIIPDSEDEFVVIKHLYEVCH